MNWRLDPASDVSMAPDEKAAWDHAVTVYERDFASRDLLFGQRMTMIKLGLVDRDDKLTGAPYDDELKTCTGRRSMRPRLSRG